MGNETGHWQLSLPPRSLLAATILLLQLDLAHNAAELAV